MAVDRIGRFRVNRIVGSGGMGEVYEGFDEELHRKVAIKGLLSASPSPERRQRLRREALTAAALSHPAIAHVYEIVTEADRDWVVMEYVEGKSLADILRDGPIAAAEIARIGAEVANALHEAHQHGIVHRDIKTENVMVTSSGHVKVLDFGLAKWSGPTGVTSDRLTSDGMVVGTSKAMSPEQATGKPLDGRSDIFSLGSLLYECATGTSPFKAGSPMETMMQIARCEFTPLAKAAPGLPLPLREAIEKCLALKPEDRFPTALDLAESLQRIAHGSFTAAFQKPSLSALYHLTPPRWRYGAAGAFLLSVVAIIALWSGVFAPVRPLTVAVLPIQVEAGGDFARLASAAVTDAVTSRLSRLEGVSVVWGRDVREAAEQSRHTGDIARALGVRELVAASVVQPAAEDPARITLTRLDGSTGRVLWSDTVDIATSDLLVVEDRIATVLTDGYLGYSTASGTAPRDASPAALADYLEVRSRLDAGRPSPGYHEEIDLLERANADSPRFLEAITLLASIDRFLFQSTHEDAYRERCATLLAAAHRIAPGDPRVAFGEIDFDLSVGKVQEALEKARVLAAARPADPTALYKLASAYVEANQPAEAERAALRQIAVQPSWRAYWMLANIRRMHGDFEGARDALATALEKSPENLTLLRMLAEVEYFAGNNVEAERLYRRVIEKAATLSAITNLGSAVFYQGRYAEAAKLYRRALELSPGDPLATANLGDTEYWTGHPDTANSFYAAALPLADKVLAAEPRSRMALDTRARCLAHLGRGPEAVDAVQDLLKAYPDNPEAMFTAALVYALIGDENSSLAWTRRALAAHVPPVWFSGPEFAAMRAKEPFTALLRAAGDGTSGR